ncbi:MULTISPECIES: 3-dehydroquinate synthase [Gammaproteobacteria]|uniref:3-dehydroquinate synthase n=1 Tax=Gammaproteobacteria TaxID=1236 RepID=UPI000DD0BD30|nr:MULTISPECIES: 3-dehydroquinate synthase [Gammaproteobacteria]RTE85919.1 3-dehydroquinate synthase [Aliidiomarina sp. B3213]TCZ90082.1 3-dehydroquinate synthase [Lysobacter sp. N42]
MVAATKKLQVQLAERSYPIHIGSGLLTQLESLLAHLNPKQRIFVISNTTVAELYLERVKSVLGERIVGEFLMPDGEAFKSLDTYQQAMSEALALNLHRDSVVLALGGGVVGDLAGFVAATLHRGVDFVQIPTTLLSQVDSSVGGKTAVNHPHGKNLIGAFHQPKQVVIDIDTLNTLPERELKAGIAEVIKYGIMADADFFNWLEGNIEKLLSKDPEALTYAIQRSCEIKAQIVSEDEKEQGSRALLNLGHTFGHVIENAMGYGNWLHGEAVASGMVIATHLAVALHWCESSEYRRITNLIETAGLPIAPPTLAQEVWDEGLFRDKKVKNGLVRFVLPTGIGSAKVTNEAIPEHLVHASIAVT